MGLKINSLIKNKGYFSKVGVAIKWTFYTSSSENDIIEKSGLYNVKSRHFPEIYRIRKPRTNYNSYFNIYNELIFADSNGKTFILNLNRITGVKYQEMNGYFEFQLHASMLKKPFDIEIPILSGKAIVFGKESTIKPLIELIELNLVFDNKTKIPRCPQCNGLLTLSGTADLGGEIADNSMICMDCYSTVNKFFNLIESEIDNISNYELMRKRYHEFMQYLQIGRDYSVRLKEIQLFHFYDLLYIKIQFASNVIDKKTALEQINKILEFSVSNSHIILSIYAQAFIESVKNGKKIIIDSDKISKIQENMQENIHMNEVSPPSELPTPKISKTPPNFESLIPKPPPVPVITPSSAIIIQKQTPELIDQEEYTHLTTEFSDINKTLTELSEMEQEIKLPDVFEEEIQVESDISIPKLEDKKSILDDYNTDELDPTLVDEMLNEMDESESQQKIDEGKKESRFRINIKVDSSGPENVDDYNSFLDKDDLGRLNLTDNTSNPGEMHELLQGLKFYKTKKDSDNTKNNK